jgi:hypothetical protein
VPAPVLEGTVVDPEGCGVEGVTVSANFLRRHSSGYNHYLGYATSRTDACGRLEVQVPGSAEWVTLWFDAPGWVQPAARTVSPGGTTLGDGTPADARALGLVRRDGWPRQRIVLERGAPIEGVVETPAGVPVPDARVEATWHGGCAETRTDASRSRSRPRRSSWLAPIEATLSRPPAGLRFPRSTRPSRVSSGS